MKKVLSLLTVMAVLVLTSCIKEDTSEQPGSIAGMGEAGGELAVSSAFELPDGIQIVDDKFAGIEWASEANITGLKSVSTWSSFRRGCGIKEGVTIRGKFRNSFSYSQKVRFPSGTVWSCDDKDYQNAILLKECEIEIPAKGECEFDLFLMCLNKGYTGSDATVQYVCKGVTSSSLMLELIGLVKDAFINYEDNCWDHSNGFDSNWLYQCNQLQGMVHEITNGGGLLDVDREYCRTGLRRR